MKLSTIARGGALAALIGTLLAGAADARNPHCAGGIQYVTQAMNDKQKGNTEDYKREIVKAAQQLEICSKEDPADFEAFGYLGWAYAEVDSMGKAGAAFEIAIQGLNKKGDVKKAEQWVNNRQSFWVSSYNAAIGKINDAQAMYPDFCKEASEADKSTRAEAEKNYQAALVSLNKALALKPGDTQTMRTLAKVYAATCDYPHATQVLQEGLKAAPGDTVMTAMLQGIKMNSASQLASSKNYDQALASYQEMAKTDPKNSDVYMSMGDILFNRAQGLEGEARKKDFVAAGDSYAKASELKPTDADLTFNAALSYQNAQMWDKAEALWAKTIQLRPTDAEALSTRGAALVELKRCAEAITSVHKAVDLKPQDQNLHRQLGSIYTRCGNNARGTDELMVYLAMHNGKAVADAAAQAKTAKQGTDAAKTMASDGVPEAIYQWEADNQKYETWFYYGKKRAYAFASGQLTRKSDWSAPDTKAAGK